MACISFAGRTAKAASRTVVLQGNGVATIFVHEVLPKLKEAGLNLNVLYVASKELFELLDDDERDAVFPEKLARRPWE